MKILDKIEAIINQHDLKPTELPEGMSDVYVFLRAYPEFEKNFIPEIHDGDLLKKYRSHIPKGWYGFDIGAPIIPEWMKIIDEILEVCVAADPNFEIHQIKLKFGGIRFYCSSEVIEDLHDVESLIEDKLFDQVLIY